jgi:exonuclease SbcC
MIIESIKISNFLSHENTEIVFEQGINIITGKNGAGKTGILDAIKFALFAESRNNEKNNELIKKGKNFFEITLNFNLNGEHYEVYRHFGLKKAKNAERLAYVKRNGVITAETYEGVNTEITKILNISREVFKNSVFVEQGQMDSLISGTPKERKTIFSDIIGLTSLSRSADRLREIIGNFRNETLLLQGSKDRLDRINENIKKLEADKGSVLQSLVIAKNEAEKYTGELDQIRSRLKERDRILSLIGHEKSTLSKFTGEINSRKKNAELLSTSITSPGSVSARLRELESNPYYLKKDLIIRYFMEKSGTDGALKELNRAESRIREYNEYLKKRESLRAYHENYSELHKRHAENSEKIKEYRKIHDTYIVRSGNLESLRERLKAGQSFLDNFMRSSGMPPGDLMNSRERRENINRAIRDKTSGISEIKSTVVSYNRSLKEARENLETLNGKNRCPLCGAELTMDHMNELSKEYDAKSKTILESIENLKTEKQSLESVIQKLETEYKILASPEVDKALSYIGEIKSIGTEKTTLEKELDASRAGYELFLNLSSENEGIEKKLMDLQSYEDEYMKYGNIITGMNPETIKNEMKEAKESLSVSMEKMNELETEIGFVPEYGKYSNIEDVSREIDHLKLETDRIKEMESNLKSLRYEIAEREKSMNELRIEMEKNSEILLEYKGIDDQAKAAETKYREASENSIRLGTLAESYSERLEENRNIAKNFELDGKKYKKIVKTISTLDKIREAFDYNGIQAMIRKDASASMTNLTRKYLQSFNLDFDDIAIDENFDIKVTQNSMEQTLESLSGGEKTALAIAIRLSVTEYVLDRISTIIMDEPTNFLDEDRRNNLKDIILYSLKGDNIVPQMIMITHHSELISVADASYEIVKHNGTSKVISS